MKELVILLLICVNVSAFLSTSHDVISMTSLKNSNMVEKPIVVPEIDDKLKFNIGKFAFSLLPLTPESQGRRKTLLKEVVKGKIWTLDQIQGIINVNGKFTIIKLF
jgi:hypothetical protein